MSFHSNSKADRKVQRDYCIKLHLFEGAQDFSRLTSVCYIERHPSPICVSCNFLLINNNTDAQWHSWWFWCLRQKLHWWRLTHIANSNRKRMLISCLSQQFKILNYSRPCTDDSFWETKPTSAHTHVDLLYYKQRSLIPVYSTVNIHISICTCCFCFS
jgi:hypothetical protein